MSPPPVDAIGVRAIDAAVLGCDQVVLALTTAAAAVGLGAVPLAQAGVTFR